MLRELEQLSCGDRMRAGDVQPGEGKGRLLNWAYNKVGKLLFTQAGSGRKRGNSFKLKEN